MAPPVAPSEAPTIPPIATQPNSENFDTPEYDLSTAAKNSNAIEAWQNGATGKGVKIGFVDTGLHTTNPDFAGKIDPASRDMVGNRAMGDDYGHGTALASIAAASQNGTLLEGIAYDATIVMMRVDKPGSCTPSCEYIDIGKGISAAADAGARVINLSIGGDPGSDVIDAVKEAAKSGVIFVISAGNDSLSNPSDYARAIEAAAPGQVIIAGALGKDLGNGTIDYNQLWPGSNRAGSFEDWYLGAPGYYVHAASKDGWDTFTGTSFSAPAVAGAIALLLQAFPNLSAKDVVQILLTSADDIGAAGVDADFGHGKMNIGKAFQPIGATALAGSAIPVSISDNGSAPSAAGDSLERGSMQAIVLDAYSRAFAINLAHTLKPPAAARPLERALAGDLRSSFSSIGGVDLGLGLIDRPERRMGFASPNVGPDYADATTPRFLSLVTNPVRGTAAAFSFGGSAKGLERTLGGSRVTGFVVGTDVLASPGFASRPIKSAAARHDFGFAAVGFSREKGEVERAYVGDSKANYRLNRVTLEKRLGRASLSLSLASLKEARTVLGGRLGQVFGSPGANSLFVDVTASQDLRHGWSLNAAARRGRTLFVGNVLTTSAYSFSIQKLGLWKYDDELSFSLSQPLRVESGGLSLTLPASYSYVSHSPTYAVSYLSLTPSGRELLSEVAYTRRIERGYAGLSFYARRQPGHNAADKPDVGAALQFRMKL